MARKKLLPDEYRKSGLVTIEMDRLEASLFSPAKLARLDEAEPGRAMRGGVAVQERYIVDVHRVDGVWDIEVEHDGVVTKIPGAVFDRITSYRNAIIKEGRQRRGKAQAEARQSRTGDDLDQDADFAALQYGEAV